MVRSLHLSLAAAAVVALCAATVEAAPVTVRISAEKAFVTTADDVYVRFQLRNQGARAVPVVFGQTPVGEIYSDQFLVTRDGVPVDYVGPLAKRPAPAAEDVTKLAPGRALQARVELTSLYDMSQPGRYEISYRMPLREVLADATGPAMLVSNPVTVDVSGEPRASSSGFLETVTEAAASLTYSRCTASQSTLVARAVAQAATYSEGAKQALNSNTTGNRFLTWFKSTTNKPTAYAHFAAIDDAFDTKPVTVDCGCKKKYYAYVYPNQPYKIYVCSVFWKAPLAGTDSQGGTLIHEMSHFDVVAGTDDVVYGQAGCKALSAADAIRNADSHEYYAENSPDLGPY